MGLLDGIFDTTSEGKMARKLGVSKDEINEMFSEFDTDGSGSIDSEELRAFAASIGIYWEPEEAAEAVRNLDADGNGTVEIGEFAAWFVQENRDYSGSSDLKKKLQIQLALRQVSKVLQTIKEAGTGRACTNTASINIGEPIDTDSCRGHVGVFVSGSNSEEFAAMNPPESAKMCAYADYTLKAGASDADIATIVDGANQLFETMGQPMLDMLPPADELCPPGLSLGSGSVFDSYRIGKETVDGVDVLRAVVFTGMDPSVLLNGCEIGDFLPTFSANLYCKFAISDMFDVSGPCTLAQTHTGRVDYNFVWNTKALKAAGAVCKSKLFKKIFEEWQDGAAMGFAAMFRVFKGQNSMFELNFKGYQPAFEAAAETAMKAYVQQQEEMHGYYGEGEFKEEDAFPFGKPTPDVMNAVIAAVGGISGKTFGNIRKEILELGPIIPLDSCGSMCTPLYFLKQMIEGIPDEGPMSTAKAMGWAALATISGFKASGFQGQIVKAGLKARGMDAVSLLPTREQIEAAECSLCVLEGSDDHRGNVAATTTWVVEHANIWIKISGQEVKAALASGDLGDISEISNFPAELTSSGFQNLTCTEEELAALRGKYSELIAVAQAAKPFVDNLPSAIEAAECTWQGTPLGRAGIPSATRHYALQRYNTLLALN